jgi:hypothetical protein
MLGAARFGQSTPSDGFLYLLTPFDQKPWLTFHGGPFVRPLVVLPEGFEAIYGKRPEGPAGTNELRGLQQFWEQQLGLWRDNKAPDWASPERVAEVSILCQAHAMGPTLLPYRLTNGAEFVCFPGAKLAGRQAELPLHFELPARLVYEFTQQGIAMYQLMAAQEGNLIPTNQLVDFANPAGRIRPGGHL